MKRIVRWPIFLGLIAFWIAGPAWAQSNKIEVLERQLKERDKVILELLERVEALEKRTGVQRRNGTAQETQASPSNADTSKPGTVVVNEQDAERALERSLTREGAVLLRPGFLEIDPSFRYVRREDAAAGFISSGGGAIAGMTALEADRLTADLGLRLGLPWDAQLELGLPYRWGRIETLTSSSFATVDSDTQSGNGFGGVRVGIAKTLLREGVWQPDLVGRLTYRSESLDNSDIPLGDGFHRVEASLSALKRQDPVVFIGGLAYQHSFERDGIQPGDALTASFGGAIALSPESSLRLLVSGGYRWKTEFNGSRIPDSDQVLGTFSVGGSTLLAPGLLLDVALGIGLTEDSEDVSFSISIPFRVARPIF